MDRFTEFYRVFFFLLYPVNSVIHLFFFESNAQLETPTGFLFVKRSMKILRSPPNDSNLSSSAVDRFTGFYRVFFPGEGDWCSTERVRRRLVRRRLFRPTDSGTRERVSTPCPSSSSSSSSSSLVLFFFSKNGFVAFFFGAFFFFSAPDSDSRRLFPTGRLVFFPLVGRLSRAPIALRATINSLSFNRKTEGKIPKNCPFSFSWLVIVFFVFFFATDTGDVFVFCFFFTHFFFAPLCPTLFSSQRFHLLFRCFFLFRQTRRRFFPHLSVSFTFHSLVATFASLPPVAAFL